MKGPKSRGKAILIYIVVFCLILSALPTGAKALSAYDLWDVKTNWARPAVNYVLNKGYMTGVSSTSFDPSGTVTRAQLAQVLYQKAGTPEAGPSAGGFADVKPGRWYSEAVEWCSQNGVVSGTAPGRFAPNDPVTREQVCVMVRNFCREYLGEAADVTGGLHAYADWSKVSKWASEAVDWAVGAGFMKGDSKSRLDPKGKTSREQLAQLLYNLDTDVLGLDPGPNVEEPPYNISTVKLANKGGVKMIAHRGGGGIATENTLEAFTRAAAKSYYGMECDVQRTKDGKYVVFHDPDLLRMTGQPGRVADYTLKELQRFPMYETRMYKRVGEKDPDLRVPTLDEYLAVCRRYNKRAIIELGRGLSASDAVKIAEIVKSAGQLNKTVFVSFYNELLIAIRKKLPNQPLMLNCDDSVPPESNIWRMKLYSLGCSCHRLRLTRDLVRELRGEGLPVGCWTVNDEAEARKFISWGVDYIFTDILE